MDKVKKQNTQEQKLEQSQQPTEQAQSTEQVQQAEQDKQQVERSISLLPQKSEIPVLEVIAEKLFKSGLFVHLKNPYQALAVIEYGRELDIPPMAALQTMAVINGRICVEAKVMLAQFQRHGGKIEVLERNKERCRIKFNFFGSEQVVSFTLEDAKRMGLLDKDNWRKYPEEMLFWRCVAKGVRATAPGVMLGVYTIEEMTEGAAVSIEDLRALSSKESGQETEISSGATDLQELTQKLSEVAESAVTTETAEEAVVTGETVAEKKTEEVVKPEKVKKAEVKEKLPSPTERAAELLKIVSEVYPDKEEAKYFIMKVKEEMGIKDVVKNLKKEEYLKLRDEIIRRVEEEKGRNEI